MQHYEYPELEKKEFEAFKKLMWSKANDDVHTYAEKCSVYTFRILEALSRLSCRRDAEEANPTSHPLPDDGLTTHLHGGDTSKWQVIDPDGKVTTYDTKEEADAVFNALTKPAHYNSTAIDALTVIDDWGLDFRLGNTIKYIARHGRKGTPLQDLEKAREYLTLAIERLKATE